MRVGGMWWVVPHVDLLPGASVLRRDDEDERLQAGHCKTYTSTTAAIITFIMTASRV